MEARDDRRARAPRRRLAAATAVAVAAVVVCAGAGQRTTSAAGPHPLPIEQAAGADLATATRGTWAQVAETAPPPPPPPPAVEPAVLRPDAVEVPLDAGWGRRVVYSKGIQRVWLIEEDGHVTATYRVSGRLDQPRYGTYTVWSRSSITCSRTQPDVCMRFMVRFAYSFRGDNIGFHEIPRRRGVPLQDEGQLGAPLSGGCVRQVTADALVMWDWAQIGTTVVVVP